MRTVVAVRTSIHVKEDCNNLQQAKQTHKSMKLKKKLSRSQMIFYQNIKVFSILEGEAAFIQ